ncbi:MAG TPA: glycosyltransferase 87 family protein [candidate division Zixibacteria bacterium]|nr:glycosyltransferase 87 family protein [candidate division Zixibacteria bacterium]
MGKIDLAGRIVAALFFIQWSIFQVMLRNWDRVEVATKFFLGNDFEYLYKAAGLFVDGKNPYLEPGFIPLPSALYIPLLLHHLSFWNALIAFRTFCFFLVVAAMLWLCRELHMNVLNSSLLMLITLTYVPFYTVLTGGNLDALMLAFLVFACARKDVVRAAFLGLSIGTKFYSLLLIPVLALQRRWREVTLALAMLAILLLPFLRYMPEAFNSVLHRTSVLRLGSNESPAVLFILLFGQDRTWAWASSYALLWGGTLILRVIGDSKNVANNNQRWRALDYVPWMAAAPALVFTYTGTILLPVLACVIRKNQDRELSWAEWLMVSGFVLTGIYPVVSAQALSFAFSVFGIPGSRLDTALVAIAPLGISAVLLGSSMAALRGSSGASEKVLTAVPTGS